MVADVGRHHRHLPSLMLLAVQSAAARSARALRAWPGLADADLWIVLPPTWCTCSPDTGV
ncbi:MAG: hypothetical protein MZW92_48725 [Comamonadaceae bacterium]|nr:hypothetical protein [Comamonadaceae bacterium]